MNQASGSDCPNLYSEICSSDQKTLRFAGEAENTSRLLDEIKRWHDRHPITALDAHRRVWYRGHSDQAYMLWPGVYRENSTKSSKGIYGKDDEAKRLNLERDILSEFRTSGATLVNANNIVEVYFTAQHYGMPTRLLDWTTNPLAALFFTVKSRDESKDGGFDQPRTRKGDSNVAPISERGRYISLLSPAKIE